MRKHRRSRRSVHDKTRWHLEHQYGLVRARLLQLIPLQLQSCIYHHVDWESEHRTRHLRTVSGGGAKLDADVLSRYLISYCQELFCPPSHTFHAAPFYNFRLLCPNSISLVAFVTPFIPDHSDSLNPAPVATPPVFDRLIAGFPFVAVSIPDALPTFQCFGFQHGGQQKTR